MLSASVSIRVHPWLNEIPHCIVTAELISAEEIRQYFIQLKTHRKVARQTSTQALCAIKMFWEKTLRRPWPHEVELVRANPQVKLPVVLSASEVRRILTRVPALDHRVCLILIYPNLCSRKPDLDFNAEAQSTQRGAERIGINHTKW